MEILYRGKPEEETYRGTCHHCVTIVKFRRSEATFHSDQRDGDYLEVCCPICRHGIFVSAHAKESS